MRITLAQHTTVASEHPRHRRDAEASGQTLRWQRPETHQNLIHPDKDLSSGFAPRGPRLHLETPPAWRFQSESSMPITFASPRYSPEHLHTPNPLYRNRGGGDRTRTDDPLLAKQVLSQLSYTPNSKAWQIQGLANEEHWWAREDLNLRPHAYQACALTS